MSGLPNLLIPGVTKAGTTSLYGYLCQHPDIHGGDMKEINFFGPLKAGAALPPVEEFRGHFRGAEDQRYRLDVSPQYLHGGPRLVAAVADLLPDARVLIMLRDPVPRLASAFGMQRFKGTLPADMAYDAFLDRCLAVEEFGARTAEDRRFRALAVADYGTHLPLWLERFPGTVRVGFTEQLKADPPAFLAEVFAWLGLAPPPAMDLSARNATFQHRNGAVAALARRVNDTVGRSLERHPRAKHAIRSAYGRVNGDPGSGASTTAADEARVRSHYAPSMRDTLGMVNPAMVIGNHIPPWLESYR